MTSSTPDAPRGAGRGSEAGPDAMRARLADYVHALHEAYLAQVGQLAPAERAALPLLQAGGPPLTVAVAAARELHVIATHDALPAPRGPEVAVEDEADGLRWTVRFYDASILPSLGVAPAGPSGDDPATVRRLLGVADVVYHLSVSLGGGLGTHHAQHAGVALANQHSAAARDGESLRRVWTGRERLVDEFVLAERLGMHHSARLLAVEIAGPVRGPAIAALAADLPVSTLRQELLRLGRDGG